MGEPLASFPHNSSGGTLREMAFISMLSDPKAVTTEYTAARSVRLDETKRTHEIKGERNAGKKTLYR